jgi:hypothetical protein
LACWQAAASAELALTLDPANDKAKRRLDRALSRNAADAPGAMPSKTGRKRGRGGLVTTGGWKGVVLQALTRGGGQALALVILLAIMAVVQRRRG